MFTDPKGFFNFSCGLLILGSLCLEGGCRAMHQIILRNA
jgi:hypothetical protein